VIHPEYGLEGANAGTYANTSGTNSILYQLPGTSTSYDAATADLISAGIHFVHASGNEGYKLDISTGVDYGNYVNIITGIVGSTPVLTPMYYNRPSSPWAAGTINVGAADTTPYSSTVEQRAFYSNFGTAVDIYAPGTGIISSSSLTGDGTGSVNTYGVSNGTTYYQANDSGTSMATPQVAGVLALFAQQNPGVTPANGKKWITTNGKGCIDGILYSTGLTDDYTSAVSLGGGTNKFLYNPYSAATQTTGQGGIQFLNGVLTLKQ
jgi:subtilisin family serine protease